MKLDTILYRSTKDSINPDLMVSYHYQFGPSGGDYPTVKEKPNGNITLDPSFAMSISEGFEKNSIFIPGKKYYPLLTLLNKAIKLTSDNLYKIFPNVDKTEFETDSRVLEIFQTEKAMSTNGMTAYPAVWHDSTDMCYPGIRLTSKNGAVVIPLDDAIPIVEMMKRFDPIVYSINMLSFFGKLELK